MFELWVKNLSTAQALKEIRKAAAQCLDYPKHYPYKCKYRALAKELNSRGNTFPVYDTTKESLYAISIGE